MVNKLTQLFNKKNFGTLPFMYLFGGSPRVDDQAIALAFKDWTFACINKRAEAIAGLDWYAMKEGFDGTAEELPNDHWLNMAWKKPNNSMSMSEMLSLTVMWLDATGNMFWKKLYNESKTQLIGFIPLTPMNIKLEVQNNQLVGYNIYGNYYDKSEIIHFKHLRPSLDTNNLILGQSLVEVAMDSITSNSEMNKFLKTYFQNEGLPPLIAYLDADLEFTTEQKEIIKSEWKNRLPNNQITVMVDNRMKIEPLNTANIFSNSGITASIDMINKQNIASIFGIPQGLITGDMQNRATSETNFSTFMTNTINPLAKKLLSTINNSITNKDNAVITVELFHDSNREFELSAMQFGLLQGAFDVNDYRQFLGYEPIELPTVTNEPEIKRIKKKTIIGKKTVSAGGKQLSRRQ